MRSTIRTDRVSFRVTPTEKLGVTWLAREFGETESAACRRVICSITRLLGEVRSSSESGGIESRTALDLAALVEQPADLPQWKLLLIAALLTGCEETT
jgi:hypothetical protein